MFFPILLAVLGCHHRNRVQTPVADGVVVVDPRAGSGRSAAEEAAIVELVENFSRVHFPTDSATLDLAARAALDANARILQDHDALRVEVEGHADERGTVDYNLALGQRRAAVVVEYLVGQGVPPSRLRVTTWGEERPLDLGPGELAWAANRRAEFRVVTGGPTVRGTVD